MFDDLGNSNSSGRTTFPAQTRRAFLKTAASIGVGTVLSPAVLRSAAAKSLTKVKMILAWLPEGSYAYAYVAKKRGYWEKRGLDVDIARGYGSLASAQAVANGQFEFGMSNPSSLVLLAANNVDLRMIGLMDYNPFMAIGLRADSPIKTPKDLESKTVGQTMSSSDAAFFPLFCTKAGVDIAKIKRLNMDAKVRNQSLGGGQVDAITGLVSSMLPSLATVGVKTRYFLYGDYGVDLYGNIGIAVTNQMLSDRPEICQAYMDGLAEGLHFTLTEPEKAVNIFLDAIPELRMTSTGPEFARLGMGVQRASVLSVDDARTHGIGWSDPAKLDQMADLVLQYQTPPGTPKPKTDLMFTNRFAGQIKLTDAEWAKAKQATEEIDQILHSK